jgi:hemerythrin
MSLIEDFDSRFLLGVPAMDRSHREMVDLVNRMADSTDAAFAYLFPDLVSHTRAHFATEEVLMKESRFAATDEHKAEHLRVLGELDAFERRLSAGRIALARAYVKERLPEWTTLHIATMDSALAAHLKSVGRVRPPESSAQPIRST